VANLWHLVTHTSEGPIAVLMLVLFCTITFGSVQIGYKIMSMGEEDDEAARRQAGRDPTCSTRSRCRCAWKSVGADRQLVR
jgi:hypothetical protein